MRKGTEGPLASVYVSLRATTGRFEAAAISIAAGFPHSGERITEGEGKLDRFGTACLASAGSSRMKAKRPNLKSGWHSDVQSTFP